MATSKDGGTRDDKREPEFGDGGFLTDMIRRAVVSGVQTVFHSEEGRRSLVSALMPRELLNTAMSAVDTTKCEAVAMIGREMQQFLGSLNVGEELTKILTSVSFELKTEVRFIPNEDGTLRSSVKNTVRPRSEGKAKRKPAAKPRAKKVAAPSEPKRGRVRRMVDKLTEMPETELDR